MINFDCIKKVNNDINVANLIEQYIKIFPKGRDFKCICPFHDDTNPSMSISVEKNIWKCFSCGVGGRSIDFVMKYKKVDLLNALKIIEKKMNYKVENLSNLNEKKYSQEQLEIFKINEIVKDIYSNFLTIDLSGADARKYLYSRHFTKEDIVKYRLGYASDDFDVYKTLMKENIKEKDIFNSMLVNQSSNKYYNFFEDRIIFPIFDIDNRVVGFSGRVYKKDNNLPKYINTKENQVFQKKDILYNLNNANQEIKTKKEVFITEGFSDVFALNKVGIENVVATMGTSITKNHLEIFKNASIKNIILFFDNDSAGQNATISAIKKLINNFNVAVVDNQTDKDPWELFETNKDDLKELVSKKRISWFDYLSKNLIKKYNVNDFIDNENFINEMFSYILKGNKLAKVNMSNYLKKLSTITNNTFESLIEKFNLYEMQQIKNLQNNNLQNKFYSTFEDFKSEVYKNKDFVNNITNNITHDHLIHVLLRIWYEQNRRINVNEAMDFIIRKYINEKPIIKQRKWNYTNKNQKTELTKAIEMDFEWNT